MNQKPSKRRNAKIGAFTVFGKIMKFIIIAFFIAALVGGVYATKIILGIAKEAPEVNLKKFLALNTPSVMMDMDGVQMDIIHTDEVRFPVALSDMGQNIKDAFISIEDERFYKHKGVDYRRTISVTAKDLIGRITGNRDLQGGSTLTQQIIKNTFLTKDQVVTRKIKEIYMALQAEELLTKDQILETYLNSIFLGGKANGVEAASRQYFGKSVKDLTVIEAAYIAGTTQSPSNYYAFSESSMANPSKYINRTKLVLKAMLKNEKLTQIDFDAYMNKLDTEGIAFNRQVIISDTYNYEYFTRPVLDQVRADLKELNGYTDEEVNELIAYGGLTIYSTMDRDDQEYAQSILNDFNNINAQYIYEWKDEVQNTLSEKREIQAAFAAVDYKTGQVRVLIGGRNDDVAAGYNRAYYSPTFANSTLRSIGSSTKPLTIYSPAIDTGILTLGGEANDSLLPQELWKPMGFKRSPNNVNFKYSGMSTIRNAIVNSYNTVSTRTFFKLGSSQDARISLAESYGEKYGLIVSKNRETLGASTFALGSNHEINKDGGNPLILAGAYGAFGNSGVVTENILYTKVTDSSGNVILENIPKSEQVIKPTTAYLLYDVMKGVVAKNVPKSRPGNMPMAGKTGTATDDNNGVVDVWFSGVTPYYSASIWFGADQRKPLLAVNSSKQINSYSTQYAFGKIMTHLHDGLAVTDVSRPGGLITASFCKESGGVPNEQCYVAGTVESELFVSGTQPTEVCTVHTYVPPVVDPVTPATPVTPGTNGNNGLGNWLDGLFPGNGN